MNNKKIITVFLVLCSLFAMTFQAYAEETTPDKFRFAFGGYALVRFDTTISLTAADSGLGASFNPVETLGMNVENQVLRIDGYYRFKPKHALTYSWYSINSDGNRTIDETFEWVDEDGNTITVPVGAQVVSNMGYDIYKLGYLWSFHHTDKVEMGVGAGLHITRLALGLDVDTTTGPISTEDVDTTVPLPVVSFVVNYKINPKWAWFIKTELFALKFDKWAGSYRDVTFGVEYRAWKNVALGAGISSNNLELEEDEEDYDLNYNQTIAGGLLYVATYF